MAALRNKPPIWFWILAVVIVLWGLMGIGAFYMDISMKPEAVAQMSSYDQQLRASRPDWFLWLYGAAVWSGFIGGVLLLFRSTLAHPVFVASLVLVIAMFGYIFAVTDLIAVKGFVTAAGFPIVITAIAAVQVWLAAKARRHGWIG